MDEKAHLAWLLDFYGGMLTPRQRQILAQHLDEDFSLTEIARMEGITRQGVYDTVKKAQAQLLDLEQKLGLLGRYFGLLDGCASALALLDAGNVSEARARLNDLVSKEGEDYGV